MCVEWSTLSQGPLVADTPAVEVWAVEVGIPINKSEMIHVSGTDHRPSKHSDGQFNYKDNESGGMQ